MKKKVLVDNEWIFAGEVNFSGLTKFMFRHKYDKSYILYDMVKWRCNSLGITVHFDNSIEPSINVSESHMNKLINTDPSLAVSLYSLLNVSEGQEKLKHLLEVDDSLESGLKYAESSKQYKLEVI